MAAVKLLIADPNASFVRKLTTYLHPRSEIEVVDCCKSGDAVLHRLSGNAPDAVLTELILDGMDGLAMMSKAHGYLGHVSFIVCTDFFNPICIRRARDLGASAFLCKPVTGWRCWKPSAKASACGRRLCAGSPARPGGTGGKHRAPAAFPLRRARAHGGLRPDLSGGALRFGQACSAPVHDQGILSGAGPGQSLHAPPGGAEYSKRCQPHLRAGRLRRPGEKAHQPGIHRHAHGRFGPCPSNNLNLLPLWHCVSRLNMLLFLAKG